jgi:hypothetical protein
MLQYKKQIYGLWLNGLALLESGHSPYFELYVYGHALPLRIVFRKDVVTGRVISSNNFRHQPVSYESLYSAVEDYLQAVLSSGDECYNSFRGILSSALEYVRLIKSQPMLF